MKTKPCLIAHRGYSSKFHPNTEEAFLGAIAHGSGGIETDVHFTADGVLVAVQPSLLQVVAQSANS